MLFRKKHDKKSHSAIVSQSIGEPTTLYTKRDSESQCIEEPATLCTKQHSVIESQSIGEKQHSNIEIVKDYAITELTFHDCLEICVMDCPRITKIPAINTFVFLETLKIKHCNIQICTTYFPDCLRSLTISYCNMREFRPEYLSRDLALIDLSFNRLTEIPPVLSEYVGRVNLHNNDLWFTMYSDLGTGFVSPIIIDELILAHRLNLIGTQKLVFAQRVLEEKRFHAAAERLGTFIGMHVQRRAKEEIKNTYNNAQNVHLHSIQDSTLKSVKTIMAMDAKNIEEDLAKYVCNKIDADQDLQDYVRNICDDLHIHSLYFVSVREVLKQVVGIIEQQEHKHELYAILKNELIDGRHTCMTGRITRIVNTLNGFVQGVTIGLSKNEELSNTILALRKKHARMYPDISEYIAETIPVAWQLLEDMCVPESEHLNWLEYI